MLDTMRAARLDEPGAGLRLEDVAVPRVRAGGVLVRVEALQVLPFTHAVLAGASPFALPTPYTPGSSGIGVVEAVADDVSGLEVGERVFLDPYLTSRVPGTDPAPLLIGWFGLNNAAAHPQRIWRDGTFAEYTLWPCERVVPLRGLDHLPATTLAPLTYLTIAYGALLRGDLRPGQKVVITGATGNLGAAAVLVALALGAERVVAAGRNERVLDELAAADGRIVTVTLTGDAAKDGAVLAEAASGAGADLAVDLVGGGTDSTASPQAALASLRPQGTLVLAGGVYGTVPVDYQTVLAGQLTVRGAFMAPQSAPLELAAMARAGTLRMDLLDTRVFPLDEAAAAVEAAAHGRGLHFTVLTCEER